MASIRELRTRIKSVGNIKQITRAMEMVATTKLRRFQDRAIASRPYSQEIAQLLMRLARMLEDRLGERPLFKPGAGGAIAVLVLTSDRGLCGAYNSQIFAELERWLRANPGRDVRFLVYGRKGYQYLTKRGLNVQRYLVDPPLEKVDYKLAKFSARAVAEAFLSGEYAEVRLLYTAFESMVRFVPVWVTLLPLGGQGADTPAEKEAARGNVILEPNIETLLEKLVPRFLETRIYNAMLEAITSEYASRRMSMKNATDAASDMQSILKGIYNRKRQESITRDLLDIVGAAEALR